MKTALPKPLHEVAGKPMLGHILDACWAGGIEQAVIVVGHGKDEVIAKFEGDGRVSFVEQTEQLGTGHAVKVCLPALEALPGEADVTILAGDLPLVTGDILRTIRNAHESEAADATMGTAVVDDPTGYGRGIRDDAGEFREIVEQSDGSPEQLAVREVFPSLYCVRADALRFALGELKNDNAKSEYYLTDIYAILREAGKKVLAVEAVTAEDVIAPNDRVGLAEAEAAMQDRIHDKHRKNGVTIVNGSSTHIEADARIGQDTVIRPFTHVGRAARIGRSCQIGPFARVPRDGVVGDGETVSGV
jgi:bifunctional UDP-N-acetylglucosamine pyrophosphorylase/glucosamine-1-phosphate N-acetyltransferase